MENEYYSLKQVTLNSKLKDICPIYLNHWNMRPNEQCGNVYNNFTILNYLTAGKGTFTTENTVYEVKTGDVVIHAPGKKARLVADENEPFSVITLGFEGNLSTDFSKLPSVFNYPPEIFTELRSIEEFEGIKDIRIASVIMRLYTELFEKKNRKNENYIDVAKEYIENNYMLPITVSDIANYVNLNDSYLSRVFKQNVGKNLQEYIISVRLSKAKAFLNDGKSVTETTYLCGFNSQSYFSKAYKKRYNCTPKTQINVKSENNM